MDQDSHSSDHLTAERISELLDEPGGDPAAAEHLETCERCEREHERLRRMRMALSALGDMEPPEDEWERIEPHLPEPGPASEDGAEDVVSLFPSGWAARLAAATVVFAVGLGAGLQLRDGGSPLTDASGPAAASGSGGPAAADGARLVSGDEASRSADGSGGYLSAARSLEAMVSGRTDTVLEPIDDPVAAAEEMARLEAMAEAAREALNERPADPALNNFLFRVNERQEALRSRLGAAARLASLDYR